MNEQAVQLITNLDSGGRDPRFIVETLVNSPQYQMDRTAAERLVQATLQKQVSSTIQSSGSAGGSSTSLGRGSASTAQSSASDSSSGLPLPKTIAQSSQTETNLSLESEEDNALESAAASFWAAFINRNFCG